MIQTFDQLLSSIKPAFSCCSVFSKARELAYGILNCSGKGTLTDFITGIGKQFSDWSAYYRIFTKARIDIDKLFQIILFKGIDLCPESDHIIVHLDDTIVRKRGKKVCGTSWKRDPLGPPFHINFIWAQRYIGLSLAIPEKLGLCRSRAVPICFQHCPTPKKPGKNATPQQLQKYKEQQKQTKLNKIGIDAIKQLRQTLDKGGFQDKRLVICADGSYTNSTVLKQLPDNTTLVGRIRKDAKFHLPADDQPATGRRKIYGQRIPSPEQVRQSEEYSWIEVKAWAAGKIHDFNIKVVENLMWRKAGQEHRLRLIVIRPLAYRLTKSSKTLYRQPAYLICTDHQMDIQKVLQAYLWRWEIEVNFRDQKSVIGVGKAHVRNKNAVDLMPAFVTAIYSLLQIAYISNKFQSKLPLLPRAKWYPNKKNHRVSTGDLINAFKAQLYCSALGISFSHFVSEQEKLRSTKNSKTPIVNAQLYARAS